MRDPNGDVVGYYESITDPVVSCIYARIGTNGVETDKCEVLNLAVDRTTLQRRVVYKMLSGKEAGLWIVSTPSQFTSMFTKVQQVCT